MVCCFRYAELREAANSLKWEDMMILYCRISIIEDYRLAREISTLSWTLWGRLVPEKTAEFLREIQRKDSQKMLWLQILGRETELRTHENEIFIENLKVGSSCGVGLDGSDPVLHEVFFFSKTTSKVKSVTVLDVLKWNWKTFCCPQMDRISRGVICGSAGLCFSTTSRHVYLVTSSAARVKKFICDVTNS
ncbi:hypothetical protein Tco_1347102 [Tanacetum coccineum]